MDIQMISFIVPAHNEEAWIGRSLAAIREAMRPGMPAHEVIVADDASTDATAAIAGECGARVIRVAHRQIAATRNAGAKEARGDVLFFVDADTLVNAEVIQSALRAIVGGAIAGGCIPQFEGKIPFWWRAIYRPVVFAMRHVLNQTGGACMFCARAGFEATGGFSEAHYAAEEDVWVRALKRYGRFVVIKETVVTSGRSLRAQSFWTVMGVFARLTFHGADGFRDREGLDLWYRPYRDKPTVERSGKGPNPIP